MQKPLLLAGVSSTSAATASFAAPAGAVVHQPSAVTYGYSLPPNTPKERVQILRKTLLKAGKAPDLLNDATKANLEIAPASAEEITQAIEKMFKTPPEIVLN